MKAILQPQLCCPFCTYFQLFITFHTDVFRTLSVSILSLQETIQTYVSRIRIFSAFYKLSSTKKKKKRYIYSHALITEKQLKCQAFSGFTLKNCMYFVHEWRALIQKKNTAFFRRTWLEQSSWLSPERQLSLARVWEAIYIGRNEKNHLALSGLALDEILFIYF